MKSYQRRLILAVLVVIAIILVAGLMVWSVLLDPGDKGDTSTDLVTPTLSAESALVFEVAPDESRVEFLTEASGLEINGVFPVQDGTITLEPVGEQLRVLVQLNISVDEADTGSAGITRVLRAAMETGDYPLAFYVATSRDLVPVTEKEIEFTLDGQLEVHNVTQDFSMAVRAQLVGSDMWAIATADLDLGKHGVEFPALIETSTIRLTAYLQSYETIPDSS